MGKKRKPKKHSSIDVEVVKNNLVYIAKYVEEALEILRKPRLSCDDKKKLKKLVKRIFRRAHASLIGLVKNSSGKTIMVDHLVVDKKGIIKHYGIHGLRGHNPRKPEQVQFKNKHGKPVEYEEIGTITKTTRKGRRTYKKRTRRIKKAG